MIGIGVDIENIERFAEKNLLKNRIFLNKIYTKQELKYCFSKKNSAQHLAVRYAAKEAVFKACSSIGVNITDYKKIEITKNDQGMPLVHIHNTFKNTLTAVISLSHCTDKAIAFAFIFINQLKKYPL